MATIKTAPPNNNKPVYISGSQKAPDNTPVSGSIFYHFGLVRGGRKSEHGIGPIPVPFSRQRLRILFYQIPLYLVHVRLEHRRHGVIDAASPAFVFRDIERRRRRHDDGRGNRRCLASFLAANEHFSVIRFISIGTGDSGTFIRRTLNTYFARIEVGNEVNQWNDQCRDWSFVA